MPAYRPGNIVSHWLEQLIVEGTEFVDCLVLDQWMTLAWKKGTNFLSQFGKVYWSEMKKKHRWTPHLKHAVGTRVYHSSEKAEYLKIPRLQDVPL